MKLLITPASQVRRVCQEAGPSHLLRLVSPDQADETGDLAPKEILTLVMHDIAAPAPGRIAPDRTMMQALLDFGRIWSGERPLVIQCWAGVSRSTAAAFAIACQKRADLSEQGLAMVLRRAVPQATPNRLMVAHADSLLGRCGRMTSAVQTIGRGADFADFASAEINLSAKESSPG